jgi:hypothetical protein
MTPGVPCRAELNARTHKCRRDPVPSTTTWAAGGAWPTAAVEVEVRGEAAAHSAFYVDGGDLVLSGLDVRAPGSSESLGPAVADCLQVHARWLVIQPF